VIVAGELVEAQLNVGDFAGLVSGTQIPVLSHGNTSILQYNAYGKMIVFM
jgi:hypothetical protein